MLVLTRKRQQKIQIGEDITITIVRIQGNIVRVGIEAPRQVRVARGEVIAREIAAERLGDLAIEEGTPSGRSQKSDSPGEETIGKSPAAWQSGRDGLRGPLSVSRQQTLTVPAHAV
jgi:carbon storage regulator CsrA